MWFTNLEGVVLWVWSKVWSDTCSDMEVRSTKSSTRSSLGGTGITFKGLKPREEDEESEIDEEEVILIIIIVLYGQ